VHNYLAHMTPEGKVAAARMLDNTVTVDNDDDNGKGGEATMVKKEKEGEVAEKDEGWYKLGHFTDALRSYADRLECIVKDKLRNNDNDNDKWDVASGDERHHRPLLLPI
jgi:hypothetical protein